MRRLIGQFARFCGVGALAALGHYGAFVPLVAGLGAAPVPAALAGYLVGGTISYLLTYRFVFASDKAHRAAAPQFFAVAAAGFALTGVSMAALTGPAGLHWLLAQVLTTGAVMLWSFAANRFWTFGANGAAR
ncbi:MAG: GtrA family protein [Rhodospirillales bacterium]